MPDKTPTEDVAARDSIDDSCRAFRLVKNEWVKVDQSPPKPSSQAFQDRQESGAMSVFLEDEIDSAGRSLVELHKQWEGYWIFSLTVGQLRTEFDQIIVRDPQPNFPGHALVRDPSGKRSQGKRSRMAAACIIVLRPGQAPPRDQELTPLYIESRTTDIEPTFIRRIWRQLRGRFIKP